MTIRLKGFSPSTRRLILERCQGHCEICGVLTSCGQAHHRRPRGAGGSRRPDTNLPSNALWLCSGLEKVGAQACHEYVESNRSESYAKGWLISQHRKNITPSAVPVQMHDGWHLLDDFGGRYTIPKPTGAVHSTEGKRG